MKFFNSINNTDNFAEVFKNTKVLHVKKPNLPESDLESFYKGLAQTAGFPIIYEEDPVTGEIRPNHWTKIEYIKGHEESSYKHSNHAQPLHTDYGYFSFEIYCAFFYCVEQAEFGGATTFFDVDLLVQILNEINPDLFDKLLKTKIHFGRYENTIAQNSDYILQKDSLGWKINWNYFRALEDKNHRDLVLEFKDFLDTNIERSGELLPLKLQKGEAVFFQDRRILHGRNSFIGNRQLNKGAIAKEIPKEIQNMLV
ncbi:MAG: TauD/TfdA family dioxygenase [Bacteroidetes bacterium]|nr:TauD/TfdA family dioxygenase [Bacteroidota bacterium]MCB9225572.1 TauD/TfdA family dioxygenase [Chitinophagales bacterium]